MIMKKYFEIINCPAYTPFGGRCICFKDRCLNKKRCFFKNAVEEKKDLNKYFEVREIEIEEE